MYNVLFIGTYYFTLIYPNSALFVISKDSKTYATKTMETSCLKKIRVFPRDKSMVKVAKKEGCLRTKKRYKNRK